MRKEARIRICKREKLNPAPHFYRRGMFYLASAVFILVPAVFPPGNVDPAIIPTFKWSAFGLLSVLSASLWIGRLKGFRPADLHTLEAAGIIYLLIMLPASAFSREPAISFEIFQNHALLFIFALTISFLSPGEHRSQLTIILTMGIILSFLGIFLGAGIDPLKLGPEEIRGITLTFSSRSMLAGFLLFPFAVAVNRAVYVKNLGERLLYGVYIAVISTCLFLTRTRGSWVGASIIVVLSGIFFLIKTDGPTPRKIGLTVGFGALFLLTCLGLISDTMGPPSEIVKSPPFMDRVFQWETSFHIFSDFPLLGSGPGTYDLIVPLYQPELMEKREYYRGATPVSDHAFNDSAEFLATTGLSGLAAFYGLFAALFFYGFKGGKPEHYMTIITGTAGLLAFSFLHYPFFTPIPNIFLWFSLGMVMAEKKKRAVRVSEDIKPAGLIAAAVLTVAVGLLVLRPSAAAFEFQRGAGSLEKGDLKGAVRHLERTLDIKPHFYQARVNLGSVYFLQRNYTAALKEFKKALEIAPYEHRIHLNIGLCYVNLGRLEKAVPAVEKSLEYNPVYPRIYALLQDLYRRTDNGEKLERLEKKMNEYDIDLQAPEVR